MRWGGVKACWLAKIHWTCPEYDTLVLLHMQHHDPAGPPDEIRWTKRSCVALNMYIFIFFGCCMFFSAGAEKSIHTKRNIEGEVK